jgi:hypothetical protein
MEIVKYTFILPNNLLFISNKLDHYHLNIGQARKKGRDTYCITYHDAIVMRWNRNKRLQHHEMIGNTGI